MQYRTLGSTGARVSILGFGAAPLGDVYGPSDNAGTARAVHYAIDQGINLFDVSPYYGRTLAEERLGAALAGKRERVFLSTKCGRYDTAEFDFSPRRVATSIDESLARLRTDHVDLLLAHDIEFGNVRQIVEETIPALRKVQEQGKARFIGFSGYPPGFLARVAKAAPVDAVLSYCHYDLLATDMDDLLTPTAWKQGLGLINASPLHMGILTERGAPAWHPAPVEVREAGTRVVQFCQARGIGTPAVALRFCLGHPYASSTLVGMPTTKEVKCNLKAIEAPLDLALLEEIRRVIGPAMNRSWSSGRPENNG